MSFLATHKQTRLVTINLRANDGLLLQMSCNGDPLASRPGSPGLSHVKLNMDTILRGLRATGFRGVLIVVNYYSLDYTIASEGLL